MLPRIQADEQLMAISVTALGGGKAKRADARTAIQRLERIAGGGRRAVKAATPDMLAAVGIAVVQAPPASAGAAKEETDG
ncbi:hypothetical protein [Nitratireductor soli]|uniref:hypothetical protein n=1 Tax=Nitratireductor soli TaxID=1670619 RepID=UPI00065E4CA7|nr:hypothetical protein [Nitratireductor soli]